MITKSTTIYSRANDGVYLHASAYTDTGLLLAIAPFERLSFDELDRRIWAEVLFLLDRPGGVVPHPADWNQLAPLYELANCRDWSNFVRGTRCCVVEVEDREIRVTPMIRDGRGFSAGKEAQVNLGPAPTKLEGTAAVMKALGYGPGVVVDSVRSSERT